jgi:hypothetical protein
MTVSVASLSAIRVQFGLGALLRAAGFDDEDENENEAPGETGLAK